MTEKRIQFSNIVRNQLPSYVGEEFPLIEEFLSQYYISQEFQGAPVDLIQNIDQYIKLDNNTNQIDSVILQNDILFFDDTIFVDTSKSPSGTQGFPQKYGLLKIDDEIITYTGITTNSFTGCIRGFSGISSYISPNDPEQLVFEKNESSSHSSGSTIFNLSSLFLKQFLLKIKHQLIPGFEDRNLESDLNQALFIKQAKDFYRSKGTDESFEILFRVLYGEDVSIIRPKEYLFRPSDSQFQITRDLVVESIEGNPENLENSTLFQDQYGNFTKAYAPISKVEKIITKEGKEYYRLSIDSNYNRDIRVEGALYGEFKVHPQTRVIGNYDQTTTTIDVDSTVGFPNSGELLVTYNDRSFGVISYTSKNLNQFFGLSNITGIIEDSSSISLNTFAYGNSFINQKEVIKVRITSVLKDLDIISDTFYFKKGYKSIIKTLGVNPKDTRSNNWFFNTATNYEVESISLIDSSDSTYQINTIIPHSFKIGDTLKIENSSGTERDTIVIDVISEKSIIASQQGVLSTTDKYIIKKKLLKPNLLEFPNVSAFNANIQNVYKDKNKLLIASSSLPYYDNQSIQISSKKIIFNGTFDSDEFTIVSSGDDHGFYTGDAVYYTPQKSGNQIVSKIFDEGIYYIYRVNGTTVKFALSKEDIYLTITDPIKYGQKFISVETPVKVESNTIELFRFKDKNLNSQKLLREISSPQNDGGTYITEPGFTGILINGVEILNYKSKDLVYYGKLDEVEVISSGIDYDVINPPILNIEDSVGIGAIGHCAVKGFLQEIKIIDPGFDYMETPVIKITGGNGTGAKAFANMQLVDHESQFNSEINSSQVSITNNTIEFLTYHKFRNAEKVIYTSNGQLVVGGLSEESSYYVSVQSPTKLKLHKTLNDAVSGINTIQLSSFGIGNHSLRSFNKKLVVGSINIENSGSGYENKKRTVSSSIKGINININQINIPNHDFKTGEIVKYSSNGTQIGGLVNNKEYYVTAINNNSFKLSEIGTESNPKDFFFITKQFVNFTSIGSGIHTFNYPEISVEVIGNVGGVIQSKALVYPIFRGEITSVHLESGGIGYGTSEILNYNRQPTFRLNSGSGAQVTPIISNGKIVEILINASGKNYNSLPNLDIIGDGIGAVLTPIIENGKLTDVKVIQSGIGYSNNTEISINSSGSSAEFFANIQKWNINLFQKSLSKIKNDDGVIEEGLNDNYGLEYAHLYAPRKLREIVYANDQDGNVIYGKKDLRKISGKEITSTDHSPIIGWAYDGNPIYGPYGYSSLKGGTVVQMKSGYGLDLKPNRPNFPEGFFIEDYSHFNVSDETVLDEYNGRFCVTPEFPNGTYAYFATISNLDAQTFGTFSGYKLPIFPFFIGNKFKSKPNEFNFTKSSNQDDLDLNATNWSRNTTPYNLIENKKSYSYLELPNDLDQTIDVEFASPGSVEKINVIFGGTNYKVSDKLIFDNEGTNGYNASAEVQTIFGKPVDSISVASTSISNVQFYPSGNKDEFLVFCENPHNLLNGETVNIVGFNTISSLISGSYRVGISTNIIALRTGISSASITGIVTYFSVAGNLNYPNIRENDIIGIGTEKIKVLNIDKKSSRIKVLRQVDGTVGSAHSATDILYEIPKKFKIVSSIKSQYNYKINREFYFNPIESVGLGTTSGIGIGVTIVFSNPGSGITETFVPTRSIYIPNHELETGDKLIYSTNNGSPIGISTNGVLNSSVLPDQSIVYAVKLTDNLIGISTFRVGLGTNGTFVGITSSNKHGLLYFTNLGTGEYHSFKTTYETLTGNVFKNEVTVSTTQSHGLLNNETVFIDVNPSIATTVTLKYSDFNKKLLIDPKVFEQSDVNIANNTITINDHEFKSGQKVVYTSYLPSDGLENNKEYYILVVDKNTIRLTNSYYDAFNSNAEVVKIRSASLGTLSKINPQIDTYKNSTLVFDVSDSSLGYTKQSSSYSAFDLKFFKDSNFTQFYNSDGEDSIFKVEKMGSIGVTTDAKVVLTITENTLKNFYYALIPVYDNNLPESKRLIDTDTEVIGNNQIEVQSSRYNGRYNVVYNSDTTFKYNIPVIPEKQFYNSSLSKINYETTSTNATGTISKIKITNKGQNYYFLPHVTSLNSTEGKNAILEVSSNTIGKIKKTKLKDIGFNFPADFTLKPSVSIPQIIKINSLSSFDSIEVNSFGRGYTTAPKLLVLDGKTNEVVSESDLKLTLGETRVEILKNTFALNDITPKILPIQNSNGVGIFNIVFDEITKDVTVTLSVGFSVASEFPFAVNDKILIENVGILSEGKGFNSQDYNYQLFTIKSVDPKEGGDLGSVTYNLSEFINDTEFPGVFDPSNSSGRIIPEKYFPSFKIQLKKNNYIIGETVISNSGTGIVEDWNQKTNFLTIVSKDDFKNGDLIRGFSSKTQGIASFVTIFDAFLNLGAFSRFLGGWKSNAGFLNDNIQRIQDSFYYQNFSYALKSRVDFDTWNDAVSTLNHTSGFKKFSNYQLETTLDNKDALKIENTSSVDIISDSIGIINLNCVYDFDLVRENSLQIGNSVLSDEIIFSNKIIKDYAESIGNRVLSIDDISPQFNSNPRPFLFSEVHRFDLEDIRTQKYITYVRDKRFTNNRQALIVTSLIDSVGNIFLNQYARVESHYDMGSFDMILDGAEGALNFYPTRSSINDFDITTLSYNINDNLLSVGSTNFGGVVDIQSGSVNVSSQPTTIVGIATTYRSAKILVSISANNERYEFDELTVIHDGSDVELLEYGQLTSHSVDSYSSSGIGTYYSYISGSQLNIDFIPNTGVEAIVNTIQVLFGSGTSVGIGTYEMKHAKLEGRSTSILSSTSPTPTIIYESSDAYDVGYAIIQASDNTNNNHQISEVIFINGETDAHIAEFGVLNTISELGTVGTQKLSDSTAITFTPLPGTNVNVKVYSNLLRYQDDDRDTISFLNSEIQTDYGIYQGTESDIRREFNLTHKNQPIFERYFEGNNPSIIDIDSNTIKIANHFFVTGELVRYDNGSIGSNQSISIATTSFTGIGLTNKLPNEVFVVKLDQNTIKLSRSAEDALQTIPKTLNITSVGIGSTHRFVSTKQNSKVLISIDNVIQSPVVSTAITASLTSNAFTTDDIIYFSNTTSFFSDDLIQIGNEIMKVEGVGIGSTNAIRVRRPWLGTTLARYSTGSLVTKVTGDYNIVGNKINFITAPYGNIPLSTTTNRPNERDWEKISSRSTFHGRSFIRSGIENSTEEAYAKNYIFDSLSTEFNGLTKEFRLTSNNNDVIDIDDKNAIILINDVFQNPGITNDYYLNEDAETTKISFTGNAIPTSYDVNASSIPRGGIIVSVGSTQGFGYQPLVSAGGTAIVSIAGTISSISIGNSGSGYRKGVQVVNVGVYTSTTGIPNIQFIGTATVSNGHIIGVNITNPGSGYTRTKPPQVIFDDPLSYSNIPLVYNSTSSGVGTGAKINIVVGQGSSVIDFEITNSGYGYKEDEILTVPIGGITGIPTTGSKFNKFEISIQKTTSDKFTGWSIGELQVLDKIDDKFNGTKTRFPLTLIGIPFSIISSKGSYIDVQNTILVFINDILQVPGESYVLRGGSSIQFTEAPKIGDTSKIIFYRGTKDVDVVDVNILETVKVGDNLTIGYDSSIGQSPTLQEDYRTVTNIDAIDTVNTNPYFGPGNTLDENLERPITWCRQTEDIILNEQEITKDRTLYEPIINPTSYIIQPVGIGSTIVYVDNLRPFFDAQNENDVSLQFQNSVTLISQINKVGASATAIVSIAGTISSIIINNGGDGYITNPRVTIQNPIGIGTVSTASALVSSGRVNSINIVNPGAEYTSTNPPIVLIEPPSSIKETNKVSDYQGDSGIIVGFGQTAVGLNNKLILDLYIPENSHLRQQSLTGTAVTISSLSTGDYFIVDDSNVGYASTSIISLDIDKNPIGICTEFINNIYQVESSEILKKEVIGIGTIYINRITVNTSKFYFRTDTFSSTLITFDSNIYTFDYTSSGNIFNILALNNFGNFSWGKITLSSRSKEIYYDYGNKSISGISTSTIVQRTSPLRFNKYIAI
jgi:hypothetical protein